MTPVWQDLVANSGVVGIMAYVVFLLVNRTLKSQERQRDVDRAASDRQREADRELYKEMFMALLSQLRESAEADRRVNSAEHSTILNEIRRVVPGAT